MNVGAELSVVVWRGTCVSVLRVAHATPRLVRLASALLLLAVTACRDEGREHLRQARARYEALTAEAADPRASGFDEVLAKLAQVPEDSAAKPEANQLRARILAARGPRPPRPLSRPGHPLDAGHAGHDHGE